jgi:hypothetical protein
MKTETSSIPNMLVGRSPTGVMFFFLHNLLIEIDAKVAHVCDPCTIDLLFNGFNLKLARSLAEAWAVYSKDDVISVLNTYNSLVASSDRVDSSDFCEKIGSTPL